MEKNIDSMKYRKSTHLAGIDVETIIAEKGSCILTIKEAFYDTNVDVSGNKTNGYFLTFDEPVKPMCVNSINRKTIGNIVKIKTNCTSTDSRNIGNWAGVKIELIFDPTVKMMGQVVGGIRIATISPLKEISDLNGLTILNLSTTDAELRLNWSKLSNEEQAYPTIVALKEKLKNTLK
ncbi:MAG: hypothetical protein LH615_04185 [Ferruginibacter sp.]|nr:hypothetical protein [Ferruginibacter sp.]